MAAVPTAVQVVEADCGLVLLHAWFDITPGEWWRDWLDRATENDHLNEHRLMLTLKGRFGGMYVGGSRTVGRLNVMYQSDHTGLTITELETRYRERYTWRQVAHELAATAGPQGRPF